MFQSLLFTGRLIKKRPLRSLLTVLQIALGVWIVVTVLTMNFQATERVNNMLDKFGDNLARISLIESETVTNNRTTRAMGKFNENDPNLLKAESSNIESAFFFSNSFGAAIRVNNIDYRLNGWAETTTDAVNALGLELLEGSFFTEQDVTDKNRVALISQDIAKQLFPKETAIGRIIESKFQDIPFEVIGVFKPIEPILHNFFNQLNMIIPLESNQQDNFFTNRHLSEIFIKSHPGAIYSAIDDARTILISDQSEAKLEPYYLSNYTRMYTDSINSMTVILGIFAFMAIIISSIGILSIMLVSVVERTREIGLRRALGATKPSIVRQVLNESIVFSLLGALVGMIVAHFSSGYVIGELLNQGFFMSLGDFQGLDLKAALYATALAVFSGLLFGLYPAISAAKMPPVDALRDS